MRSLSIPGLLLLLMCPLFAAPPGAPAFSFSQEEQKEAQARASRSTETSEQVARLLSVPCRNELKKKKIAVVIGERHSGAEVSERVMVIESERTPRGSRTAVSEGQSASAPQATYGMLVNEINQRLSAIGLKTYSESEISAQVARAEMEAFLNNNMDAAAGAASRLGANFFLRGIIETRTQVNTVLRIQEVFVSMAFTLVDASGRVISNVGAKGDAYSGGDTLSVALDLIREQADLVVAQLYHDYCAAKAR